MANGALSLRDRKRVEKQRILGSEEFRKWLRYREEIQPYTSDPYRAYMIDRSLRAKYYDEPSWIDYVNRSDLVPIDNARGSVTPDGEPIHRKHRKSTFRPASKIRPQHEKEKLFKSLESFKQKFVDTYHLASARLLVDKREGEGMTYTPSNSHCYDS